MWDYSESLGYFVVDDDGFDFAFVSFCKISKTVHGVHLERKNHWWILSKKNINEYLSSMTQCFVSSDIEYP